MTRVILSKDLGLASIPGALVRSAKPEKVRKAIPRKAKPVKQGKINPKDIDLAFPRTLKARKPAPKATKPEAVTQRLVEEYCERLGLQTLHMPEILLRNTFARGRVVSGAEIGAMVRASDEVGGLPDLLIFDPRRHGLILCIELKTEVGKLKPRQKNWKATTGAKLCRSFEEARAVIDAWMGE